MQLVDFNTAYSNTRRYSAGKMDCDIMAVDIWHRLASRGIVAVIAVGNLDATNETFVDCDHTWLLVFNAEGSSAALEPTNGAVYTWIDTGTSPELQQYWEGFVYENPTDLRADFPARWHITSVEY
jgi:hypothetical protein